MSTRVWILEACVHVQGTSAISTESCCSSFPTGHGTQPPRKAASNACNNFQPYKCAWNNTNTHGVALTVTGLQSSSMTVSTCPATEGRCHSLRPPLLMRPRSRLLPATTSTSHTPGTPERPSGTLWRHLHNEVGAVHRHHVLFVSLQMEQPADCEHV
jgi:hypothetical protein